MDKRTERTWAEIDLKAIVDNMNAMKARLRPETRFLGVVKADAYGHGAVPVARALEDAGCDYLAVATLPEAMQLRDGGVRLPVLILGYTTPEETEALLENDVTQAVSSLPMAEALSERAERLRKKLKVHLALDTGMGRFGALCHDGRDATEEYARILRLPGLDVEGVFTHFAVSDEPDGGSYTRAQYEAFVSQVRRLEEISGHRFAIKHCANSGARVHYTEMQLDRVRPGIALYGCFPGAEETGLSLRETMALKTRVAQVKELRAGDSVSYGRTFTADRDMRIAVLCIGYADGLHRAGSGKASFLLRGRRVRQIGRICMDLCMIDVTDVPDVAPGDIVTVFGRDGDAFVSVEEAAAAAGTISYEVMCAVSARVPRIYA